METPKIDLEGNLLKQMQDFASYTVDCMDAGDKKETIRCIRVAETLWKNSENKLRDFIDNIFVFTVSCHAEIKGIVTDFFNTDLSPNLYKAYMRQVNSSCA